jgi:hypothetical protein
MTKITQIDKPALLALRPQIDEALKELGERLGLSFSTGNGAYAGNAGHFKIEIKVDDPAVQEAAARKVFEQYAHMFGLEPTDFGIEFGTASKRYRLIGLNLNRPKWPFRVLSISENKEVFLGEMATLHIKMARPAQAEATKAA